MVEQTAHNDLIRVRFPALLPSMEYFFAQSAKNPRQDSASKEQ